MVVDCKGDLVGEMEMRRRQLGHFARGAMFMLVDYTPALRLDMGSQKLRMN